MAQFRNVVTNPESDPIGYIYVSTRSIMMFPMALGITASEYLPVNVPVALQDSIRISG
ncbi:hypothetical protein [Parapedobacter tibetensis]|uniref:hypothetical protein n=1 Tax=Parapedobacter tibetensis TaxID=2972951 RepID=UPI00214D7475|nr:hypothetical protein [Parapedobacter tibetensis]